MLTVELIVRRGTDGAVITRVVGDACTRVTWTAPGHAPIVEGSGGARLLEGFTYAPSLRKTREAASLAARRVEPPLNVDRCAVCGWPLVAQGELGCWRGNCSQRPLPARFYDPARVKHEYGPHAPKESDPYDPSTDWQARALKAEAEIDRLPAGRLVDPQLEVCICAALYMPDDYIIRGHRHDDCLMTAGGYQRYDKGSLHKAIQGFLTTHNRFVTREEGMNLMLAANAVSAQTARPFTNRGGILFSEDLY